MATPRVTIDQLPEQAAAEDTNFVIVQDEGITKKMSMATLKNVTSTPLAAHLTATVDAHDATAISAVASGVGVDSTTVQGQLSQLAMLVDALPSQAESDTRYVNTAGDTLTGPLLASGAPTVDLQVATKKYVDDSVAASSEGITQAEADALYVNVTGDTMSGGLSVEGGLSAGNLPITNVGQAATATDALQKGQADLLYLLKTEILNAAWPVGSIYISASPTNPSGLLGGGTWVAFGVGRTLFGFNGADADFNTAEEFGGNKTHTLTQGMLPAHTHSINHDHGWFASDGQSVNHVHSIAHAHAQATTNVTGQHTHDGDALNNNNNTTGSGFRAVPANTAGANPYTAMFGSGNHSHVVDVPAFSGNSGTETTTHTHGIDVPSFAGSSGSVGAGSAIGHLPPYVVTYMWKRTA